MAHLHGFFLHCDIIYSMNEVDHKLQATDSIMIDPKISHRTFTSFQKMFYMNHIHL